MYMRRLAKEGFNIPTREVHKLLKAKGAFWREWLLFDSRLLQVADELRATFGKCTVNDWFWGGQFNWSGFRTSEYEGSKLFSQHSHGRALDMKFGRNKLEKIQSKIIDDRLTWKEIKGLEKGEKVTWLHVDVRNSSRLMVFNIN